MSFPCFSNPARYPQANSSFVTTPVSRLTSCAGPSPCEGKLHDLLDAFLEGKNDISDELVFRSPEGAILDPDNLYHRIFLPVLAKAGIRKVRLHDLRHTFGSLLLQNGPSIVYLKEQMGHSSIQVTVDTYGHLIPGANVSFVDRLDEVPVEKAKTSPQQSATPAQPREMEIPAGSPASC